MKLNEKNYTKSDAERLYPLIPKLYGSKSGAGKKGTRSLLDFDSARDIAWAFRTIYEEANGYNGGSQAVRATLKQLAKELKLRLPKAPDIIETELKETLDTQNNYDPTQFRKLLNDLASELSKKS